MLYSTIAKGSNLGAKLVFQECMGGKEHGFIVQEGVLQTSHVYLLISQSQHFV